MTARPSSDVVQQAAELRREVSPLGLVLYGLGTIVGAGIYVVIGDIIERAGPYAPFAFLLAAVAAAFTGLAYAELAARIPVSGGSAAFVDEAFGSRVLTALVGWAIVATGIISAAAITSGFVAYAGAFFPMPRGVAIAALVCTLTAIAALGIRQTAWFMAATTLTGIAGLCWVVVLGWEDLHRLPDLMHAAPAPSPGSILAMVLPASFLAFYAFIGFEDLVTLSEESQDQARAMPRAIVLTLLIAMVLYVLVSAVVVSVLWDEVLLAGPAPLVDLVQAKGGSGALLAAASLAMIINGALAQIVMVPRVILDLGARRGLAFRTLCRIEPRTGTPLTATIGGGVIVLVLALFFPTARLAGWTSFVILLVFMAANAALIALKLGRRGPAETPGLPMGVPIAGFAVCAFLLIGDALL